MKFVYVCLESDRDKLMNAGLQMVGQRDDTASLWAFCLEGVDEDVLGTALSNLDVFTFQNVLMF